MASVREMQAKPTGCAGQPPRGTAAPFAMTVATVCLSMRSTPWSVISPPTPNFMGAVYAYFVVRFNHCMVSLRILLQLNVARPG